MRKAKKNVGKVGIGWVRHGLKVGFFYGDIAWKYVKKCKISLKANA